MGVNVQSPTFSVTTAVYCYIRTKNNGLAVIISSSVVDLPYYKYTRYIDTILLTLCSQRSSAFLRRTFLGCSR